MKPVLILAFTAAIPAVWQAPGPAMKGRPSSPDYNGPATSPAALSLAQAVIRWARITRRGQRRVLKASETAVQSMPRLRGTAPDGILMDCGRRKLCFGRVRALLVRLPAPRPIRAVVVWKVLFESPRWLAYTYKNPV
jgi:hypothetical protein